MPKPEGKSLKHSDVLGYLQCSNNYVLENFQQNNRFIHRAKGLIKKNPPRRNSSNDASREEFKHIMFHKQFHHPHNTGVLKLNEEKKKALTTPPPTKKKKKKKKNQQKTTALPKKKPKHPKPTHTYHTYMPQQSQRKEK